MDSGVGIKEPLWFVGVVENRNDVRKEGRVQVRAFGVHGTVDQIPTSDLPWAILISGMYDANVPIPPLNSWVFGFFVDGRDAQQPMILGLIPTQMTQLIEPSKTGWGSISKDTVVNSQGSRSQDFGKPAQSDLARGESIHETYVHQQEVARIRNVVSQTDNPDMTWEEPSTAYHAQYPYNRVIETAAGHTLELDDTPGAERIMIWHRAGSYMQIDSRGTTVLKSTSDKYDISDTNHHVYIGGRSMVTIMGDSYVNVTGNKIEEIGGDLRQIVRGNYELSVAGQMNLNASEEIQMRAAKLRFESNVENISLKSARNINIQSTGKLELKSDGEMNLFSEGALSLKTSSDLLLSADASSNMKGQNIFLQTDGTFNLIATTSKLTSAGSFDISSNVAKLTAAGKVSISGSMVAVDDIIQLANGLSDAADVASPANDANVAGIAEGTSMPEPASKSTSSSTSYGGSSGGGYRNLSSIGSAGYGSSDDGSDYTNASYNSSESLDSSYTQGALAPLLDLIGTAEGAGYSTIVNNIRQSDYPSKDITSMTIQEVLDWQDSVDALYEGPAVSEAVGRYQIIEDTLRTIVVQQNAASLSDLYSPGTQDKLAIHLLKAQGLNSFLRGDLTNEEFANNLSKTWASFPVMFGSSAGNSRYGGQHARVSMQTVINVLETVKSYKNQSSNVV